MTVDSADNVGKYSSLALDSGGAPRISYHDVTNKALKFASFDSEWTVSEVDQSEECGLDTSLALDENDNAHISYYNFSGELKYMMKSVATWSLPQVVDSSGAVSTPGGEGTSLAIADDGTVHISYFDFVNEDLKHAWGTSGSWSIETVDSNGDVGSDSSLAIAPDGTVHITYYDRDNKDLKHAWLSP